MDISLQIHHANLNAQMDITEILCLSLAFHAILLVKPAMTIPTFAPFAQVRPTDLTLDYAYSNVQ